MVRVVSHFGLTMALTAALGLGLALVLLRIRPRWKPTALASGAALLGGAVVASLLQRGRFLQLDQAVWRSIDSHVPDLLQDVVTWATVPFNHYVAPTALLALSILAFRRHDAASGYRFLLLGPALAAALWVIHTSYLRGAPADDGYLLTLLTTSPNEQAAYAVAATAAMWQTRWRLWVAATGAIATGGALLAGQAWLSDVVLGLLFGGAFVAIAAALPAPVWRQAQVPAWVHTWFRETNKGWWGLVAVGTLARILSLWTYPYGADVSVYSVMGWSVAQGHGLMLPWGGVYAFDGQAAPSHHFPPAYPWLLGAVYRVTGPTEVATHGVSVVLGLAAIWTAWWTTRDLYGQRAGAMAATAIALNPVLVWTTGEAMPESLVLALFAWTLWAILKSLQQPAYIIPAGILAGISYLSKSSIGYFFIIAGLGGLAWRLRFRGWRVLRDPYYATAITAFVAIVAAWSWRNWRLFGSWETSAHLSQAYGAAAAVPLDWLLRTQATFLLMAVLAYLLLAGLAPWVHHLRRLRLLADEHTSGLWLAALLPLLLTSAIDAALWIGEHFKSLGNVRYLSFVAVPLLWLLFELQRSHRAAPTENLPPHPQADAPTRVPAPTASGGTSVAHSMGVAVAISLCVLLAGTVVVSFNPLVAPDLTAPGHVFGGLIADGEDVAFVAVNTPYAFYFGLTHGGTREVTVQAPDHLGAATAEWLITPLTPGEGYEPVASVEGVGLWRRTG